MANTRNAKELSERRSQKIIAMTKKIVTEGAVQQIYRRRYTTRSPSLTWPWEGKIWWRNRRESQDKRRRIPYFIVDAVESSVRRPSQGAIPGLVASR